MDVTCPYCGRLAGLVDATDVYSRPTSGKVWACFECRAWVGVHKNSKNHAPLGTLANAETRYARAMAHKWFDPIWKGLVGADCSKNQARTKVYTWLAGHLGIAVKQCHIGLFDLPTCVKVVEICSREHYNPDSAWSLKV